VLRDGSRFNLRIKIEKDAAEPEVIRTVWGKGYKFMESSS
jgi:DNA-binding response OmpR family regulator